MPEIAFLMGKSSSGKDHIFKALIEDKQLELNTITLYTTRPMRAGEQNGVEYYFVDDSKAQELENAGKIIEMRKYDTMYGIWKYFTADDGQINIGNKQKYIVIGTIEAYNKFCEYFGKDFILPIYIEVDDGIRLARALKREQNQEKPQYEEMCRRFLADSKDFSEENIKAAGITKRFNNDGAIENCISEIKEEIVSKLFTVNE